MKKAKVDDRKKRTGNAERVILRTNNSSEYEGGSNKKRKPRSKYPNITFVCVFSPLEKTAGCDKAREEALSEKDEMCKILWKRGKWERKGKERKGKKRKGVKVKRWRGGFFILFTDGEGSY